MTGTPKQIKWAESLKPAMLEKVRSTSALSPALILRMEAIEDATWWIANKDRSPHAYRWPEQPPPPPMDEDHSEPTEVWQVPVRVNGKPFTLNIGREGIEVLRKAIESCKRPF